MKNQINIEVPKYLEERVSEIYEDFFVRKYYTVKFAEGWENAKQPDFFNGKDWHSTRSKDKLLKAIREAVYVGETQEGYNKKVEEHMNLFKRSISEGITLEEKAHMDALEKEIRASKFYK